MGNQKATPTNFVATVFGNLTPLNNTAFSKARLKIFYKGLNRNGSYITDEVAEQMLSTLPGTPVVGTFNGEKDDFEGHLWDKEQSKAYGFVPQEMNFNWEMSLDPDGVYRTYACVDVVLWTGRYPVASRIVGKSHSMELNADTIRGHWVESDEEEYGYYQFEFAEFIGLCILGEEYEPCFEGSSFYELHKDSKNEFSSELQEMFSLYKSQLDIADENLTGGQEMEDENKDSVVDEEVKPTSEELDQEEQVPAEDGNESNDNEDFEEEVENNDEEPETDSEEEADNAEEDSEKPTEEDGEEETDADEEESDEEDEGEDENEESDKEPELNSQLAAKDAEIAELKAQLEELNSYKAQKVHEEKEEVLNTYSNKLSEEEIENFKAKLDEYESAIDLKKEIALTILDKEVDEAEDSTNFSYVKNHKEELKGAEAIVARYAKK